jgi:hypothetical protein
MNLANAEEEKILGEEPWKHWWPIR